MKRLIEVKRSTNARAIALERYVKSGPGVAFAQRHLRGRGSALPNLQSIASESSVNAEAVRSTVWRTVFERLQGGNFRRDPGCWSGRSTTSIQAAHRQIPLCRRRPPSHRRRLSGRDNARPVPDWEVTRY